MEHICLSLCRRPPSMHEPVELVAEEIEDIFLGALALERPWSTMLCLVILTGRSMSYVQQMGSYNLHWKTCEWSIVRSPWELNRDHIRLTLAPEAIELLFPYHEENKWCFFRSPTSHRRRPAKFCAEQLDPLKTSVGLSQEWDIWDCARSAAREIERLGGGRHGHIAWSERIGRPIPIDPSYNWLRRRILGNSPPIVI